MGPGKSSPSSKPTTTRTSPPTCQTFDHAFDLPAPPRLIVANQAGNVTNPGWALEESMDVEWAHAIAPGADILVVEAHSQTRQSPDQRGERGAVHAGG